MTTDEKEIVAKTLTEDSTKITVGKFRFTLRPITLSQIYEMSVLANDIKPADWGDGTKVNVLHELLKHGKDANIMCEIFIVCAFRKKIWRKIWGRYIHKRLDILAFNQLIRYLSTSFNANFFLTSITFLTQTKIMTEPRTTTRHGQQSGE